MTAAVHDQSTVVRAVVYNSYGPRQFTVQTATHQRICQIDKDRTEYSFVRSGKSEAKVTNNARLRSTYCTIEANY